MTTVESGGENTKRAEALKDYLRRVNEKEIPRLHSSPRTPQVWQEIAAQLREAHFGMDSLDPKDYQDPAMHSRIVMLQELFDGFFKMEPPSDVRSTAGKKYADNYETMARAVRSALDCWKSDLISRAYKRFGIEQPPDDDTSLL